MPTAKSAPKTTGASRPAAKPAAADAAPAPAPPRRSPHRLRNRILVLLVLGGLALGFGTVGGEPGSHTVLTSSLTGSVTAYAPDGWHWAWQRLVPGDTTLVRVPAGKQVLSRTVEYFLPPGEIPVLRQRADFRCEFLLTVDVEIGPEAAAALVKGGQADFKAWSTSYLDRVEARLRHLVGAEAELAARYGRAPALREALEGQLTKDLQAHAAELALAMKARVTGVAVSARSLPDPDQYLRLRAMLAAATPTMLEYLREYFAGRTRIEAYRADSEQRARELEAIGKLLDKYPKLLQYLAVDKLSGKLQWAIIDGAARTDTARDAFAGNVYRELLESTAKALRAATGGGAAGGAATNTRPAGTNTRPGEK